MGTAAVLLPEATWRTRPDTEGVQTARALHSFPPGQGLAWGERVRCFPVWSVTGRSHHGSAHTKQGALLGGGNKILSEPQVSPAEARALPAGLHSAGEDTCRAEAGPPLS